MRIGIFTDTYIPNVNGVTTSVITLKEALEKDDLDEIKKKTESLQEVTYALAAKVYQQANPEQNSNTTEDKKDDGVKEADYEEK